MNGLYAYNFSAEDHRLCLLVMCSVARPAGIASASSFHGLFLGFLQMTLYRRRKHLLYCRLCKLGNSLRLSQLQKVDYVGHLAGANVDRSVSFHLSLPS